MSNQTEPACSADMTDQIAFDMYWRELMLRHQAEDGPGKPLYFPTSVMRAWLRCHLHLWESGDIDDSEFRDGLRSMLNGSSQNAE